MDKILLLKRSRQTTALRYYFFATFLALFLFVGSVFGAQDLENKDPRINGLGKFQVFEKLRGKNLSGLNEYIFTVSPDENWIITLDSYPSYVLNLFYIPTEKKWSYAFESNKISVEWFPNCFSKDSSKIYLKGLAASISSDMDKIDFKESSEVPDMENLGGSFLGFNGVIKKRNGQYAKSWWSVDNDEEEYAWSFDNTVLYEAGLKNGRSNMVISSDNFKNKTTKDISFSIVVDAYLAPIKEISARFESRKSNEPLNKTEATLKGLLNLMPDETKLAIYLDELSVSPNKRFLAGIATIYPGRIGYFGVPFGVLIPLDSADLIAYPFSRNVFDKIIWSNDSKRIYYYAHPTAGGGNGTIYRLELGDSEEAIITFPPSRKLSGYIDPDAGERERREEIAKFHYESLSEEFKQEKLIIDVAYSWVLIEGNHIIDLNALSLSRDERKDLDTYVRELLVGKRAKIILPDSERFSGEYSMSLDPFPGLTREVMPRDQKFGKQFGKIHADLIIEGQSVTQAIREEAKKWQPIWNKRYLEKLNRERK